MIDPTEWHTRFSQQARWTHDLRSYLYQRVNLPQAPNILDVGCGTGALAEELIGLSEGAVHGLDINQAHLKIAQSTAPRLQLTQADAHFLPFPNGTFDLVLCHFLLLWVSSPLKAILEMKRVSRPGGAILALAEPDYGGRIDYPPALEQLGQWQAASLRQQGADPLMGRKLAQCFHRAGLVQIETGVLGAQWVAAPSQEEWQSEWSILAADLAQNPSWDSKLEQLRGIELAAWQNGTRVLFVPTFYAWGRIPS
ncbi:MAG: methyltransferase domain-containing protein [Anaerolineales bacterium]|nr:methyltransferase domain-containing protein [Anaerolineales bacterium]